VLFFYGLVVFGLRPHPAYADHLRLTANPATVEIFPGNTAEVELQIKNNNGMYVCLEAFVETTATITLSFPGSPCGFTESFSAQLLVAVGADVAPGTYHAVIVASITVVGGQQIHAELILPLIIVGCQQYVVTLEAATGALPPDSTAVTQLHATVVEPPTAVWSFMSQGAPTGVAVVFAPSTFLTTGTTEVRITIDPAVAPGTYPIQLIPFCNGVPLSPLTYDLTVLGATPTTSPSPTSTPTATLTPTSSATPTTPATVAATPTATASSTGTATPTDTPTPTPSPTLMPTPLPDLTITGIEVTQVIQNLANQAPLIANKMTVVRVYIRSDQGHFPNVSGRLYGRRNGALLSGAPRRPRQPITAQPSDVTTAMRDNLDQSLFFVVPNSWPKGEVTFEVELNPERTVAERDYTNNTQSVIVTFHQTPPLKLWLVRIRYTHDGANLTPTWDDFWPEHDAMLNLYPLHTIDVFNGGVLPYNGDLTTAAGMLDLLNKIWWRDFWTFESVSDKGDEDSIWMGLVHQDVNMARSGWAYDFGVENAINEVDPALRGISMAHETGHTLGRRHINCGGATGVDPVYPYNPAHIADGTARGYYGFNTFRHRVIRPTLSADFMTYCWADPWVSDYTYRALWETIKGNFGLAARSQSVVAHHPDGFLALTGVINTATLTATLDHFYRVPDIQTASPVGAGPYTLEFQDETGQRLLTHSFDVTKVDSVSNNLGNFAQIVPFDARTRQLVIKAGDTLLATQSVSAQAPQVTLLSPNGGEILTDTVELVWRADDADGDSLRYMVQYSADHGATWQAVAVDLDSPGYTLDTRTLPGSEQALLRIIASDGVNTGQDQSDAGFTVPTKAPAVYLIQPTADAILVPDTPVVFVGYGHDPEDGLLNDSALTWYSDHAGTLGTGATLMVNDLAPGLHLITLTGTDTHGNQTRITHPVLVAHSLFLPLIQQ